MVRILLLSAIAFISFGTFAQYKATKVDEQGYIQNSLTATSNGILYATASAGTGVPFDLYFAQGKGVPVKVAGGLWKINQQTGVGTHEVFFTASDGKEDVPQNNSPFLFTSVGTPTITKLWAMNETEPVVIDEPVKSGNSVFFKVGTSMLKSQIWETNLTNLATDTALGISNTDVISPKGNTKYRMVDFRNELYFFGTTDGIAYEVYRTTNRKFSNTVKITDFKSTSIENMNLMIAGTDTLYMFYKNGTGNSVYCFDGTKTELIGQTTTTLIQGDVITIGNTLYFAEKKMLHKISGKTITQLPTPFGSTTTINWIRAVGNKVAFIATDATYGKEARLYDPADNSVRVIDIVPGTGTTNLITYITPIDNKRFVFFSNPGSGNSYYVTDGINTAPIALMGDIPISNKATPVVANGYLYFVNFVSPTYQLYALDIADIDLGQKAVKEALNGFYNHTTHAIHVNAQSYPNMPIDIYDIAGRKLQTQQINGSVVPLRPLPSGIYIAKIQGSTLKFRVE